MPEQLQRPLSAITIMSSASSSLNVELESNLQSLCDNYLEQSYIQLKILCIEQVKKPGKDHSKLFKLILESQLTLRMRQFLIRELVYEATRFKRVKLVEALGKFSSLLTQITSASISPPKEETNEEKMSE
jgi:hypothetical protein